MKTLRWVVVHLALCAQRTVLSKDGHVATPLFTRPYLMHRIHAQAPHTPTPLHYNQLTWLSNGEEIPEKTFQSEKLCCSP